MARPDAALLDPARRHLLVRLHAVVGGEEHRAGEALGHEFGDLTARDLVAVLHAYRQGAPWLGMKVAELGKLDRVLVVGSFLNVVIHRVQRRVAQRVREVRVRLADLRMLGAERRKPEREHTLEQLDRTLAVAALGAWAANYTSEFHRFLRP